MGDKLTDRQKHIIGRAGFRPNELDYLYGAPTEAREVVMEVVDYFDANPPGPQQAYTLPFPVETQTEQTFEVLATIVEKLGAGDITIDDNGHSATPRLALQEAARQVFLRLGRAARATIDHDEEIAPTPGGDDTPETGDSEDPAPDPTT